MTTAMIERPQTAIVAAPITDDQVTLIKNTIAKDATPAELQLFFYDCQRRGVHPLDRLIHFTKRGGKYTPITSIDFMRSRAHETGDCAGITDAEFSGEIKKPGFCARVVVTRIVQGQRAEFPATARWEEYKPEQNAFMWDRMPHTMLGKCAEALALRKAFPQQLAGLYAREEMDQAGPEPVITGEVLPEVKADRPAPPAGACYVERVTSAATKNKNVTKYSIVFSTGETAGTINQQLSALAEQLAQGNEPVVPEFKETKWGNDLVALHRAEKAKAPETVGDLPVSDIAF